MEFVKEICLFDTEGIFVSESKYLTQEELRKVARRAKDTDGIVVDLLANVFSEKDTESFVKAVDDVCFTMACIGNFQEKEVEELVVGILRDLHYEVFYLQEKFESYHEKLKATILAYEGDN